MTALGALSGVTDSNPTVPTSSATGEIDTKTSDSGGSDKNTKKERQAFKLATGTKMGFEFLGGIGNFMAANQMAAQLEESAEMAGKLTAIETRRIRRDRNRRLGALQAAQGASGFQTGHGSPLAVMADEAFEAALDVRLARLQGDLDQVELRRKASTAKTQGINSLLGGFGRAASTGLGSL